MAAEDAAIRSQPEDMISEEAFLFTPSPRITCILVPYKIVLCEIQISGTVIMTHIILPQLPVHK